MNKMKFLSFRSKFLSSCSYLWFLKKPDLINWGKRYKCSNEDKLQSLCSRKKKRLVWGRHTLIGNVKTWRICAVFLRANIFVLKEAMLLTFEWVLWHLTDSIMLSLAQIQMKAATESSSLYVNPNIHV